MDSKLSEVQTNTLSRLSTEFAKELAFQTSALNLVSRSFALTIPELPDLLRITVGNAYLLCRIADSIEDDPAIDAQHTELILQSFIKSLQGQGSIESFIKAASQALSGVTDQAEKELILNADKVVHLFLELPDPSRRVITDCIQKMCAGMSKYQPCGKTGLETQSDLDLYCYYVAGVVGEMLTDLFCDHAEDIAAHRAELKRLSASFGQGLQMTNIIKDVWADLDRGYCWLPRDLYDNLGYDLERLSPVYKPAVFRDCQAKLIATTHGHLSNALTYSLTIPAHHRGIRIFCLWAVGLAIPTLQRVRRSDRYYSGATVKVPKLQALLITRLIASSAGSNSAQTAIFKFLSLGLPHKTAEVSEFPEQR